MSKTFNLEEYDTIVINDLSLNGSFLTNFQVGVPIGTILPWQDINTIPDGWKLCDGNGTYTDISGITRQIPDLRSKFIIGHDARDTSFNIDTSGSSFINEDTDLNTNKPRSQMILNDTNEHPTDNTSFRRIFYSLAYIIRVSNPNISTDAAGDKVINGDLTATGNLFVSNNVGIGTTSPSGQLHISSGTNGDCQLILEADTDNNNETDNPMILFRQDGGADRAMIGTNDNDLEIATSSNGNILFKTGGGTYSDAATGVRIDQNGNLGIGNTSPGYQLDIYKGSAGSDYYAARFNSEAVSGTGNTSTTYLRLERGTYGGAIGGYIKQGTGSGLVFSNIVEGNLGELMRINHVGWVGIGTASPSAKLDVNGSINASGSLQCDGLDVNDSIDVNIDITMGGGQFYLNRSGGSKIKYKTGFLNWENNDGTATKEHDWRLSEYSGDAAQVYFRNSVGNNRVNLRALSVSSTSDDRLKTNEILLTNATETIMKLKPQLYDHYANERLKTESMKSVGLIAQEIYYDAPELRDFIVHLPVDTSGNRCTPIEADLSNQDPANDPDYEALGWTKDEYASVDYTKLIPYLIKSNQEQQEEINTLKSRLSALDNN